MKSTASDSWLRRIRNARGLRWLAGILASVLLICGAAFHVAGWLDWRPLTLPVDLKPGVTRSSDFRVGQETRYLVVLEVERKMFPDDLLCLLGGVQFRPPCSIESVVDMQWTLWSDSQVVASGSSRNENGWGFGSTITRTIGQFEGSRGTAYVLEVVSILDGSVLAATNPRIVVQVNPGVYKGHFVVAFLGSIFLAPAAGVAAICLIIWAVRGALRARKPRRGTIVHY